MSGAPAQPDAVLTGLAETLAALRPEVEAAGISVPGSPRAPRPVTLGRDGSAGPVPLGEEDGEAGGAGAAGPVLGGPVPLIAVATTADSEAEAMRQAIVACTQGADLVEVRADLIEPDSTVTTGGQAAAWASPALATARLLAAEGHTTPVLLTVRTSAEGGGADVDDATYRRALLTTIRYLGQARATGRFEAVRAVDVEIARGCLGEAVEVAHEVGLAVVGSAHFFTSTPSQEEIVTILRRMEKEGADVAKIAVVPRDGQGGHDDVVTLLRATAQARAELEAPVITMSMGEGGVPTRLLGGVFGSALTFATASGGASAPGQMPIELVRAALELLRV
ncbi:type I 3-dehydroquinate dehydratase [Actinomyces respiraculi]|uniref:type I 3-dehydroquinate dehydratase n=1 Tax=Actinomyces respiraculi TaxID=2744574 RepID=UPI0014231E38|nr:type I 3-dehydroquinate dehydratase [Actinomyces respiraculi]